MEQRLRQINDVSIGNNLRNLRNAANLTQEQVVAQLQLRNLPTEGVKNLVSMENEFL